MFPIEEFGISERDEELEGISRHAGGGIHTIRDDGSKKRSEEREGEEEREGQWDLLDSRSSLVRNSPRMILVHHVTQHTRVPVPVPRHIQSSCTPSRRPVLGLWTSELSCGCTFVLSRHFDAHAIVSPSHDPLSRVHPMFQVR